MKIESCYSGNGCDVLQNTQLNRRQKAAHYTKISNQMGKDSVTFGNKDTSESNTLLKLLGACLVFVSGFGIGALFKNFSVANRLLKNAKAAEFIESAKKQKAEIVEDKFSKMQDCLARIITKKFPSGTEITHVYVGHKSIKDTLLFRKIIKTNNAKSCVSIKDDKVSNVITIYNDGSGKLSGYCAFRDKNGEYLQLSPDSEGWSVVRRASKQDSELPVDLKGATLSHKSTVNGEDFEYLKLPNVGNKNNEVITLKNINEADIGYPFGPEPFDLKNLLK